MPLAANGIWYADHRQPSGTCTPVLLIHGAGGTHLDWPPELRRMPEANAIAPDLPGHGRSTTPARSSAATYAADLLDLLDALKLPQVIALGHSLGGAVAQMIAIHHPRRVAGLILIGTGAKLSVHPDILNGLRDPQLREQTVQKIIDWQWADGFDTLKSLGLRRLLEMDASILYGDFLAAHHFDSRGLIEQIRVPTLVIGGTADRMTPLKYSEYLRDHIPGAQLVVVQGGGHMMMLEQPQVVASAVQMFLEGLCKN